MGAALAALVDLGEIREEQPRATDELEQRSVMIGGKRIDSGLHIGEVLHEERRHVGVEAVAIRHRRSGRGARPRARAVPPLRGLRQPAQRDTVADIPGDPRQLADAVGRACDNAGQRIHVSRGDTPAYGAWRGCPADA